MDVEAKFGLSYVIPRSALTSNHHLTPTNYPSVAIIAVMLSTVVRNPHNLSLSAIFIRSLTTETVSSSSGADLPPLPPPKHSPQTSKRTRLYPHPRPAVSHQHKALPALPTNFGRNQLLPVSNSTRALLESIVDQFDAPIRYAFAYGSGVFEQDGYTSMNPSDPDAPMLDFMLAVTHPGHFHSINMHQHPSHYPLHARVLGSDYVSRVQSVGPGVWFNAYVPMKGVVSYPSSLE